MGSQVLMMKSLILTIIISSIATKHYLVQTEEKEGVPPAIYSPPSEDAVNDEEHNENQNKRNHFPTLPPAFYSPPPDADADTENEEFYDIMKKNHFLSLPPGTYTPPDDIDY